MGIKSHKHPLSGSNSTGNSGNNPGDPGEGGNTVDIDYILYLLREMTFNKDVITGSNLIVRNNLSSIPPDYEGEDTSIRIVNFFNKKSTLFLEAEEGEVINVKGELKIINQETKPIQFFLGTTKSAELNSDGFEVIGSLKQTSVTSSLLKTDSSGKLIPAIPGVDYLTSATAEDIYIKNQVVEAQDASYWIKGSIEAEGGLLVSYIDEDDEVHSSLKIGLNGFQSTINDTSTISFKRGLDNLVLIVIIL